MELIQPLASTAARFVTAKGAPVFIPDLIKAAQERYRFWRVPLDLEEYSHPDGAVFTTGIFNGVVIDKVKIYNNGIAAESRCRTEVLDECIDDIMQWATGAFGLSYEATPPIFRGYTSSVEIKLPQSVADYAVNLRRVGERLTAMVSNYGFQIDPYEFTSVIAITDPIKAAPIAPSRFLLDRRAGQPFSSGIFYSEAPLQTGEHLELLSDVEAIFASASPPPSGRSRPAAPAS